MRGDILDVLIADDDKEAVKVFDFLGIKKS
jgi:hypothetical protein